MHRSYHPLPKIIRPYRSDFVHVLYNGKIVKWRKELAHELEEKDTTGLKQRTKN
jgi:Fe-S cluster assembly ATPase SufC